MTTPFVYGGRVLASGVLEIIMAQFPLFEINCWVMVVAKYLQVEDKMVQFDFGSLAQVGNVAIRL